MNQENEILTAEEAAAFLRMHIDTIRRYSSRGLIPCFRVGKFWRYNREALTNWVAPSNETSYEQVGE